MCFICFCKPALSNRKSTRYNQQTNLNWTQSILNQSINIIFKHLILTNESKSFEYWKHPPVKVYRKFYFFDIQNPAAVQEGTEKPRLAERGPYTYSVIMEKQNVEFLGTDLIRYSPTTTLFFEPSMSVGDQSDLITVVNVPALVKLFFFKWIINTCWIDAIIYKRACLRISWRDISAPKSSTWSQCWRAHIYSFLVQWVSWWVATMMTF